MLLVFKYGKLRENDMARIMIQGTTSSAGKSLLCTALCRIFSDDGYKVIPFKSQNMSSTYFITKNGEKMSIAQSLQAKAARKKPHPDMNPILLIPSSEDGSMVVVKGKETSHMKARKYFEYRPSLKKMIADKYKEIESQNDIVVIEGAGSPAEINLKKNDIVNMGMAEIADSPVLLVTDIDRGGSFAALYGTIMLLEKNERARIKGMIINKFRGDKSLLDPGIKMIEELVEIPVVGVIPYLNLELAEEDSLIDEKEQYGKESQSQEEEEKQIQKLADAVRENMDLDYIYHILRKQGA